MQAVKGFVFNLRCSMRRNELKPSSPLRNRFGLQNGNVLSKTRISDQFTLRQFRKGCCPFQNILEVVFMTKWCFDGLCWILHFENPISNYFGSKVLPGVLETLRPWHTSKSEMGWGKVDCGMGPPLDTWFSAFSFVFKCELLRVCA